ncbi:MAG: hypothetical protein KF770_10670 [Anaerolineae bacterium]|nr:hypothetical protein [Anaerolineae bacterium]
MSLLTVAELQQFVETHLSPAALQEAIDWVEAQLAEEVGAPYTGAAISETHAGYGRHLFLNRPIGSVTEITEYGSLVDNTGAVLAATDYTLWADEGIIERAGAAKWGARVAVAYVPRDDRDRWRQAIIDLARLLIDRTALQSESVAGEMSYTAPANWEAERRRVARRLSFRSM